VAPSRRATLAEALVALKQAASEKVRNGMARFGLPNDKALGVSVADIQRIARRCGRSQELAEALWRTGIYEARMLAAFVGEPAALTPALMNRWCRDFDNWAVVDTLCFKLFDQGPHAWGRIEAWAKLQGEFQRRAGFVLLACVAAHAEDVPGRRFFRYLPLLEWGATTDSRNFVRKGVSWALRMVGRRSPALCRECTTLARRLAASHSASARWISNQALKEFAKRP
jgi:3-methyladenine DNA glycosylase AlkD